MGNKGSSLALVMHGGGMRGAYGAGVMQALVEMVDPRRLGILVGTSAGAANLAAWAAGIGGGIQRVWMERLHKRDFINPFRVRWMTDIDYLMTVCAQEGITNERIRESAVRLFIAVTRYADGAARFFNNTHDVMQAVRASVSMPVLSRTPVEVEGTPYLDGGISAPLSLLIERAFAEGAEKVIAVDLSSPLTWWQKIGLWLYAQGKPQGLRQAILAMIRAPYPEPQILRAQVYLIRLRETMVTRLHATLEKIAATFARGREDTLSDYNLRAFLKRDGG